MQSELIVALEEANREIKGLVSKLSENNLEADSAALPAGELQALSQKLTGVRKLLGRVSPAQPEQQVRFTSFPRRRESSSFRTEVAPRFRGGDEEALQAAIDEYVANLKTLKMGLGKVQDSLGKQRDRLKKDLKHSNSARAWLETFRATNWT